MSRRNEYQVENGKFTRIVNASLEDLVGAKLNGVEFAVCVFIIRKTWGFRKKKDRISLTQFEEATGYSRKGITKALGSLILGNKITLINKEVGRGHINEYSYNKYWRIGNRSTPIERINREQSGKEIGNRSTNTKESITKEITPSPNGSVKSMIYKKSEEEKVIDADSGEEIPEAKNENTPLFLWGQSRLPKDRKFTNPIKQKSCIKSMLHSGYTPEEIKNCWLDLEDEKWLKTGVDFGIVLAHISKAKAISKPNPLLYGKPR